MRSDALATPVATAGSGTTSHEAGVRIRDAIELLVLGALWGSSFLFMRVAAPDLGPVPLIAVRVTVAAILLCALTYARGLHRDLFARFGALTFVGFINSALPFSLFAFATLSLSAGFASVLNATVPLFGALIAFLWFRERVSRLRMLGLGIGFLGVIVLVSNKLALVGDRIAVVAGLVAAVCYGVAAHFTKRRLSGVDPLIIAAGSQVGSSLVLAIPAILLWPEHSIAPRTWGAAFAVGLLGTAVAYVLYFRLLRSIGPSRAMVVTYLIPVFGILWGHLVLGEAITANMLAGGAIIVVGTMLVARANRSTAVPASLKS